MNKYLEIFGLPFFVGSKKSCRRAIMELASEGSGRSVVFANAHVIVEAHENTDFKQELKKSNLVVPDGVPLTWLMHGLGAKEATRYSGPDLMEDLFEETKDKKHFFLGSSQMVLDKIKAKFKGNAVGFYSPPFNKEFTHEELNRHLALVEASGADFVWVGLGAPKQEKYVVSQGKKAKNGVWCAVGAAFDFYAETKPRAPLSLQSLGLEWAYRMFTEPQRLVIRYLKTNPIFMTLAFAELAKFKRKKDS